MTPQDMIARYAHDVARRLPQRMRDDVRAELNALLLESLRERAGSSAPTLAMAHDILVAFGAPNEVALRYHAPGPIIDPADGRLFSKLAFGLVLALGVLAVSVVLSAPAGEMRATAERVTEDYADGALQILGALLILFWIVGAWRRRFPGKATWAPKSLPQIDDPDRINRLGSSAAIIAWTAGLLILANPVAAFDLMLAGDAPAPLRAAFAFDPEFARDRAGLLWLTLAALLVVQAWATMEGRWRALTQRVSLVLGALLVAVCLAVILAGPIFISPATDEAMKFWTAAILGFSMFDMQRRVRDEFAGRRATPPARAFAA